MDAATIEISKPKPKLFTEMNQKVSVWHLLVTVALMFVGIAGWESSREDKFKLDGEFKENTKLRLESDEKSITNLTNVVTQHLDKDGEFKQLVLNSITQTQNDIHWIKETLGKK